MAEPYFHQEYPKWKFHASGQAVLVMSADEADAYAGDWYDSLRELGVETCPQASALQPMAQMIPGYVPPAEEGSSGGRS